MTDLKDGLLFVSVGSLMVERVAAGSPVDRNRIDSTLAPGYFMTGSSKETPIYTRLSYRCYIDIAKSMSYLPSGRTWHCFLLIVKSYSNCPAIETTGRCLAIPSRASSSRLKARAYF
jgi:hypothetical protein